MAFQVVIGKTNFLLFNLYFYILSLNSIRETVACLEKSRPALSTARETRLLEYDLCAANIQEVLLL